MRFHSASLALLLPLALVACGDDSPMLSDTGVVDTGAPDTGTPDTGTADTGTTDTGTTDTGTVDTGPPTCTPVASGITFPTEEWNAEVVAEGSELVEPVSVSWNASGLMLITNSASWIGASTDAGNIIQNDSGTSSVFATDPLFQGPGFAVWNTGAAGGFEEGLYVAIEDASAAGGNDGILEVAADGSTVTVLSGELADPGEVENGPGGDFGDDLFVTSRERYDTSAPNPREVYTVASDGTTTRYAIMDGSSTVTGAWALEFGPGGDLGSDLYLGTIEDPGFSPGSMDAIYRVRASDGEASVFAASIRPLAMAAPAPGGDFGAYLYVVTSDEILRVDRTGSPETFATGIMSSAGLRFGSDGALYLAQPGAARVIRITPCGT